MQILKLFQWFQPITNDHTRQLDGVINDVVQYDCEYGEKDLQISHAYTFVLFQRFVSQVNTLKRNWNKTISLKQNIVLRLFFFSFISVITTALDTRLGLWISLEHIYTCVCTTNQTERRSGTT